MADVESANVVGYTTKALRAGATMLAPCFKDVAKNGIDLNSITVTGYDPEEGTAGDIGIQILGPTGRAVATYYWYDVNEDGDILKGWLDVNDDPVEDGSVVLQAGDGLWVTGLDGYSLMFPGEVNFDDVSKALRNGATPTGNMMAVSRDLTTVTVSGYDAEEGSAGDVGIQVLGPTGRAVATYYWYDVDEDGDILKGWLDINDDPVEEGSVMLQAGDGLWVTGLNGLFINVIAPEL